MLSKAQYPHSVQNMTFHHGQFVQHLSPMKRWPRDGRGTPGLSGRIEGFLAVVVLVCLVPTLSVGQPNAAAVSGSPAPPPTPALPQGAQFSSLRTYLSHQQSLVNQLDDRVRGLEQRYHPKRLEDLERRLASLDAKLEQIMPALERRFDRLTEALSTHDHKSSLSREQLVHKVDDVYDRVIKLQLSAGQVLEQTKELRGLRAAVDQVGAGVNSTRAQLMNMSSVVEGGARAVEDLGQQVKGSQDDAEEEGTDCSITRLATDVETATKVIKQHVDIKTDIMSSKVSNLYNDMWRRINALESMVKSGVSVGNATRRDVLELRVLVQGQNQRNPTPHTQRLKPPSGNLEMALETLEHDLQKRLNEVETKLSDQVANVQFAQDIFLRTCDRLDDKGDELEEKISNVMDRLIDMVVRQDKDLVETHRLLKSHNHQVTRALANATEGGRLLHRSVLSLSEDSTRARGLLRAIHNETIAMSATLQNVSDRVTGAATAMAGCSTNIGASDEETWSALLQQANETVSQLQDQAVSQSHQDLHDITLPQQHDITSHQHPSSSQQDLPPPTPTDQTEPVEQNRTDNHRQEGPPLLMVIHGLQRLADTYSAQSQRNKTFEQFINEILPRTPSTSHITKTGPSDLTTLEDEDYLTNDNQDETDYSF